jgi:hypothetical protein
MFDLKLEVENYYKAIQTESALYKQLDNATLKRDHYAIFINNLHYLVTHTVPHLKLAAEVSRKQQRLDLEKFFAEKIAEEIGHEEWAKDDLHQAGAVTSDETIALTMKQYCLDQSMHIKNEPVSYLGHIFFAEYFTVIAGPKIESDIKKNPNLVDFGATIITNHAELDKAHVVDDLAIINGLTVSSEDKRKIYDGLQRAFKFYSEFIDEVTGHLQVQ